MTCVLAVDDSASMRRMIAASLVQAGLEVVEAVDGADALERLHAGAVDVVLTDHNMPRMDGLALTRAIRASAGYRSLPVLILTTEADERMKQAARDAGANGWLLKPFDPARLAGVLRQVAAAAKETP